MARTYVKGRNKFKRQGHKYGHCKICGYDPRLKGKKKNKQKAFLKFHILPYLEFKKPLKNQF